MLNLDQIRSIVSEVNFFDWKFPVELSSNRPYLQVMFHAPDTDDTNLDIVVKSRKWFLSYNMTKSEIVQTCFLAVQTAIEHEVREKFLFRKKAIFGPHISCEALTKVCEVKDVREDVT